MLIYNTDVSLRRIYSACILKLIFNRAIQIMTVTVHCWTISSYNTLILQCVATGVKKMFLFQ